MRNVIYSLSQSFSYRIIDWYVVDAASFQLLANSKNHIDYFHLLLPLHPRFQILSMIITLIRTFNRNVKDIKGKKSIFVPPATISPIV